MSIILKNVAAGEVCEYPPANTALTPLPIPPIKSNLSCTNSPKSDESPVDAMVIKSILLRAPPSPGVFPPAIKPLVKSFDPAQEPLLASIEARRPFVKSQKSFHPPLEEIVTYSISVT